MRAAAVHSLADVSLPKDIGQHWSLLARDYVMSLMKILSDNPSYVSAMSPTDYGFEVHFKLVEPFLSAFKARGVVPKQAMKLFNQLGLIAYGGAIESIRQGEFEYHDETMDEVARRQFARLDPKEFPNMAEVLDEFTRAPEQKAKALIASACRSFARDIGQDEINLFEGS